MMATNTRCIMNDSDRIVNSYADSDVLNSVEPFKNFEEFSEELRKVKRDIMNISESYGYRAVVIQGITSVLMKLVYDVNTELHMIECDIEKLSMQCSGSRSGWYARRAQIGIERIIRRYND